MQHGRLDALVNNVGGPGSRTYVPTAEVTPALFDQVMALNVRATFFCSQAAIARMAAQGGGSIVNITSVVGNQAMARQTTYAIAKAAVDHLTRCLAVEHLGDEIPRQQRRHRWRTHPSGRPGHGTDDRGARDRAADPARMPPVVGATPMDEIVDAIAFLCEQGIVASRQRHGRRPGQYSAGAVFSAALLDAMTGRWTTDDPCPDTSGSAPQRMVPVSLRRVISSQSRPSSSSTSSVSAPWAGPGRGGAPRRRTAPARARGGPCRPAP